MYWNNFARPAIAAVLAALGLWLLMASTDACGPFFPNTIIDKSDEEILKTPLASFRDEIGRIKLKDKPVCRAVEARGTESRQTADADLSDLRAALKLPAWKEDNLLSKYAAARKIIRDYCEAVAAWKERGPWLTPEELKREPKPVLGKVVIPDGLPKEFASYIRGALKYHKGDRKGAAAQWKAILELPAVERSYRSTWAAFMAGKALMDSNPKEALKWFAQVRKLAKVGFSDSLGLAVSSYGWEARTELNRKHFKRAVELYLLQHAAGDDTAVASLRITATRILKSDDAAIQEIAGHQAGRRLINAHLVSGIGPHQGYLHAARGELVFKWLKAIDAAKVKDVEGADRLAWMAYQSGDMEGAGRWLKAAAKESPIAQWLGVKLLLRAGKLDEAAAKLSRVVASLPRSDTDKVRRRSYQNPLAEKSMNERATGELAVLRLARSQYAEALDLLLRADFWMDGAYVAESVLTPDELKKYVDANWQKSAEAEPEEPAKDQLSETRTKICYLLGRRLARLKRWEEARPYYPKKWQPELDKLVKALKEGENSGRTQSDRAKSLWKAARLTRKYGIELLGTELEPDWQIHNGHFEQEPMTKRRAKLAESNKVTVCTSDERARVKKRREEHLKELELSLAGRKVLTAAQIKKFIKLLSSEKWKERELAAQELIGAGPKALIEVKKLAKSDDPELRNRAEDIKKAMGIENLNKRFHYRYVAAELAWSAALLMPEQSDDTARVLCTAGTWLKDRDPQAADRFYKALVLRCGTTRLGKEADRLRWFPKLPAEK